jgi:nucleotide-binding universal stress UspA family protein
MARRLLVVATAPVDEETIRGELRRHSGDEEAEVRVVAPAAELSPLQWLANEEDDARAQAEQRAEETASAADPEAAHVETSVGDPDPVQAIEDMLRDFPADELIVVTRRDDEATFLEKDAGEGALERFGLPVTHLTV